MRPLRIDTTLTLFSGSSYTQYDLNTGQLLTLAPRLITDGWAIPFRKVDAAVHWEADSVYIMSAMQVVRYRLSTSKVESGYPKIIPFYWRGLWASDIDAVLRLNQQAYFFRKEQYIAATVSARQVSFGSAQPIASRWPGLPRRITGAIPLANEWVLFLSEDNGYVYSLQENKTVLGPIAFPDLIREGVAAIIRQVSQQEKLGEWPL